MGEVYRTEGRIAGGGVSMARPRKEIDQKQFENLCGLQCTLEEICGFFDVTDKTGRCRK